MVALVLPLATGSVAAGTKPPFDPRSTQAAPCGVGVPPPGHVVPELRPPPDGVTLTVRQDGNASAMSRTAAPTRPSSGCARAAT